MSETKPSDKEVAAVSGSVVNVMAMLTGNATGMVSSFGAGGEAAKAFKEQYEKTAAGAIASSKEIAAALEREAATAKATSVAAQKAVQEAQIARDLAAAQANIAVDKEAAAMARAAKAAEDAAAAKVHADATGTAAAEEAAIAQAAAAQRAANAAELATARKIKAAAAAADASTLEAAKVAEAMRAEEAAIAASVKASEVAAAKKAASFEAMTSATQKIALGTAAAAAIIGGVSVEMAGKFEKSTELLVTAGGEAQANLQGIRDGILQVSQSTGVGAEQLSEGMYTIEKAGMRGSDGLLLLKSAAQAAVAEGVDMSTMTTALTSVMTTYGLKASDSVAMTNQMVVAAGASKTSMQEFAGSLSTVLPIAQSAHLSFDQIGGAIATMTQHGTSAQEATQELRNAIQNLLAPNNVAIAEMNQLGISSQDVSQNLGTRGLTGTLDMMREKVLGSSKDGLVLLDMMKQSSSAANDMGAMIGHMTGPLKDWSEQLLNGQITAKEYNKNIHTLNIEGSTTGQQFEVLAKKSNGFNDEIKKGSPAAQTYVQAMEKMMGGTTGLQTMLMLTGDNMGSFITRTKEVGAAANEAGDDISTNAATQATLAAETERVKATFEALAIQLGTALMPVVKDFLAGLLDMINWLQQNKDAAEAIGIVLAVVAGSIAAIAVATWAWEAASAAAVLLLPVFTAGMIGLDAAMDANPIGFVVLAIEALIAILVGIVLGLKAAYEHIGWFKDGVDMWVASMKVCIDVVKEFFGVLTGQGSDAKLSPELKKGVDDFANGVKQAWQAVQDDWKKGDDFLANTGGMFADFYNNSNGMLNDWVKNSIGMFGDFGRSTGGMVSDWAQNTGGMFNDFGIKASRDLTDFNRTSNGMFEDFGNHTGGMIADWAKNTYGMFSDWGGNVAKGFQGWWHDPIGETENFVNATGKTIDGFDKQTNGMFMDFFHNTGGMFRDWAANTGGMFTDWVAGTQRNVNDFNNSTDSMLSDWAKNTGGMLKDWAVSTGGMFIDWVSNSTRDLDNFNRTSNGMFEDFGNNTGGMIADWAKNTGGMFDDWGNNSQKSVAETNATNTKNIGDFNNSTDSMLSDWAKNTGGMFADFGANTTGMFRDWGTNTIGMFQDWHDQTTGKTREFVDQALANINEFDQNTTGMFSDFASNTGGMISDWYNNTVGMFTDFYTNAIQPIQDWVTGAIDAVSGFVHDMEDAAGQAVQGFVNGLTGGIQDVINGARDLGQGAIDAIRNVLDMHSPSRVTTQAGQDTAQGFTNGIADGSGGAVDAVTTMGQNTADAAKQAGQATAQAYGSGLTSLQDYAGMELAKTITSVTKAATSGRDAQFAFGKSVLQNADAATQLKTKLGGDLSSAIDQVTGDFNVNTLAGQSANQMMKDVRDHGMTVATTFSQDVTKGSKDVTKAMSDTAAAMVQTGKNMGLTDEQAQALTRSVLGVPPGVDINTWMSDEAKAMADKTKAATDLIPRKVGINIEVYGMDKILAAQAAGDNLAANSMLTANRYADGNAYQKWTGGEVAHLAVGGFPHGGPVSGPGTGVSDSIATMLSNHEFVIKASSALKYGPALMNSINDGTWKPTAAVAAAAVPQAWMPPAAHAPAPAAQGGGDINIVLDVPELGGRLNAKIRSVAHDTGTSIIEALNRATRNQAGVPAGGY